MSPIQTIFMLIIYIHTLLNNEPLYWNVELQAWGLETIHNFLELVRSSLSYGYP